MPVSNETQTFRGTVAWFNNRKGFGFIKPSNGGKDIFVHYNELLDGHVPTVRDKNPQTGEVKDMKVLIEATVVEYQITQTTKGPKAINVKVAQ